MTVDYDKLPPITPEIRRRVGRADPTMTVSSILSMAEAAPGVEIIAVAPGSLAESAGVVVGEKLMALNGEAVRDTIDFFFVGSSATVRLDLQNAAGGRRTVTIRKRTPEEDLGIELRQFTTQQCGCNCVFCFVHQLPDSMRKSLYVKDEDYRLSFLQGGYMTGVTLKPADLDRIARQRLTPLYISVHAVDETVRKWLLGIRKAVPILDILNFFKHNRIQAHTQIVLTPGHNDGERLQQTLSALMGLHPTVQSIAIVPLGLTKWREGLPDLSPVDKTYATRFLKEWIPRLRVMNSGLDEPMALLADEWYLIAGRAAPSYSQWPDVPQLENGVGMVYHFYRDFADAKKAIKAAPTGRPWRVGAVTSTLSAPVLSKLIAAFADTGAAEIVPLPTVNHTFGETIHVTGLLTARDIERTLRDHPGFDQYLLPGNCLRKYDEKFLDDVTLTQLREKTGVRIDPVLGGSLDFALTVLEARDGIAHSAPKEHPFLKPHWSNT